MKDQKKAEEIAARRVQLLSPLLADGLDPAKARQLKVVLCEQSGLSERTLRRYLTQYRKEGFTGVIALGLCGCIRMTELRLEGSRNDTAINYGNPT
ncbi:hypothetical protein JCM17380_19860 [Desulfosporosinus burensis]